MPHKHLFPPHDTPTRRHTWGKPLSPHTFRPQYALALLLALRAATCGATTWHVDSTAGDDTADGRTPATAWRTLTRVNAGPLAPGDRVLFRRGGLWRGQLRPASGAPGNPIVYSWYGKGPKPILQNAVDCSRPECWFEETPGIWSTRLVKPHLQQKIWDGQACKGWHASWQGGVKGHLTRVTENGETFLRALCTDKPKAAVNLIQLWGPSVTNLPDTAILRIKIRATQPFSLGRITLLEGHAPWTCAMSGSFPDTTVEETWQTLDIRLRKNANVSAPRIHLRLGNVLPKGVAFDVIPVGIWHATWNDDVCLLHDVGLLICNHGQQWGVKKWRKAGWQIQALEKPLDYWYDPSNARVLVRFDRNPATAFSSIELAYTHHIIDQGSRHDIVYDGLCVRYGAAHGFGGGDTRNIVIRNCDICWIGGGLQFWRRDAKTGTIKYPVRFGNGIEFWSNASGHLVERNRIWEIYDAALTNQGRNSSETDIVWRDNVIWNAEYSFEYWNAGRTANITFEHNTCVDAGWGWAHAQRPNQNGAHLMYYHNTAATTNVVIRNNIFCRATEWTARSGRDWREGLVHDHNLVWNEGTVPVMRWLDGAKRVLLDWHGYRALGFSAHGVFAKPVFVDAARRDYRLAPDSPGLTCASDGGPVGARNMPGLAEDQSLPPGNAK